jgi:hypothetical protein
MVIEDAESKPPADRQLPTGDEIFLDHVGHFCRGADAASKALARVGFAPTPVSVQVNPDGTLTGTGNVTAMLRGGYIEALFKTADTPLGQEFDLAMASHSGVHLAAFSIADAAAWHGRLAEARFPMRPLVNFQRPVDTETGPDVAAFTVVRLERGAMAEGRIQMLTHRTEHTVWQPRWLSHPNGAVALVDLVVACVDVSEAANRFTRFASREAMVTRYGQEIVLDRGRIQLMTRDAFAALLPEIAVPGLPFMGAYAVRVRSLGNTEALLREAGMTTRRLGGSLVVPFPTELGVGAWLFVENDAALPWRA